MLTRRVFVYISGLVLLLVLLCGALFLYVHFATRAFIYQSIEQVPHTEVALVLGASVTGGGDISQVFQERVDKARDLYRAGKVSKILVTGDNSTVAHNEVDPVARYLVLQGIPTQDIFLDHAGFDTYSSMYRARDVFDVSSMTIVSQPFHLPRAVFLARAMGVVAYGVSASEGELFLFNYLREIPATVKAVFDVLTYRVPKYLGPQFNIEGDGSETWGGATTTPTVEKQL